MNNVLKILKNGGIILYPTDTVWGIGCDATNFDAVQKIFELKKRAESKSMICLVNTIEMLKTHVEPLPEAALDIINKAKKPTTIIYDNPIGVAHNLIADDDTLAIRLVKHDFCETLIEKLGHPLVSTSANISGQPTPTSFKEISEDIIKGVDYVVDLPNDEVKNNKPSSIIKLSNDGNILVIRE
ncbi:L-threonylcarbamoyladenylate synthase [uncultured Psychroserpens sp.]|uniref:L-threonylcarbamoyladenylate synthase n=1 Tax=uncultured Psychroserpens sp. TaxID=255436 RepID=UPI0026028908|nr:L-threonylcarbamoyladenylate synthase [uncultured Psychroserpens sp.]